MAPAAFLFVLVTAAILAVWRLRGKSFALGIPLLLAVHGTDLLRWRLSIFREETVPLSAAEYEVQRIAPLPFIVRRSSGTEVTDRSREFDRDVFSSGVLYDYVDPFLHRDVSWSRFLVTQWSPPLDLLLRTYCGAPLETPTGIPLALVEENASSRAVPEPFARIIGESEGKLQVFSAAHPLPSDEAVARVLKRKDFQGNILLLTRPPGGPPGGIPAARNERLPAEFEVRGFSPNRLSLDVRLPPGAPEGWLVYCDSWHPAWTATVNGAPQPIERAFLAYKAVRVPAGTSSVEFRFRAPLRSIAYLGVGVQSLLWLGLLGGWSLRFLGLSRAAARL